MFGFTALAASNQEQTHMATVNQQLIATESEDFGDFGFLTEGGHLTKFYTLDPLYAQDEPLQKSANKFFASSE